MAHVLEKRREWVLAHSEIELAPSQLRELNLLAEQVKQNKPLAYITGNKEFYGRDFRVTPDVLIPRPETEQLVEIIMERAGDRGANILDVGTGSGCIAITLALELPNSKVTAVDISPEALEIAQSNAKNLKSNVSFKRSDLFSSLDEEFAVIVANLPYVDRCWEISPGTAYEPEQALYATEDGLELIRRLVHGSPKYLTPGGYLTLEADTRQHESIIDYATKHGFELIETRGLAILLRASL